MAAAVAHGEPEPVFRRAAAPMTGAGFEERVEIVATPVAAAKPRFAHAWLWILAAALICYLGLAFSFACVKTPWVDEGWIASAPANWAQTGSIGTPSLEPTGSWLTAELTGIHEYNYLNMPVALFLQGLWFKAFGVTVLTMRSLGILFGLAAVICWFLIVAKLAGNRLAGALTAVLLAFDYTFLWSAADGRMDMMCMTFGAAGMAAYLYLREKRWDLALWCANAFLALALFTHPNGMLAIAGFGFLLLYHDRRRLSWRDLASLAPYLALAVLWGAYALQRPDYFLSQFAANATARGGARWSGIVHPLDALRIELLIRYVSHYGMMPMWGGPVPKYALAIPLVNWLVVLLAWFSKPIRRSRGLRALLSMTVLCFTFMTLFVGMKSPNYLGFIVPLYAGVFAVWLWKCHLHRSMAAPLSLLLALAWLACQAGTIRAKIRANSYATEYTPTVEFIRARLASQGGYVLADSCFGFNLGFDRVRDDARIGYYSGAEPNLIVEDLWYDWWWNRVFPWEEPELGRYVRNRLASEYRIVFERGPFRVYERRPG